jgi:hypothetical protein
VRDGQVVVKALIFATLLGCVPRAMSVTAEHPASPDAQTGRLAGPPPALRPGVTETPPKQPEAPPAPHDHQGHH